MKIDLYRKSNAYIGTFELDSISDMKIVANLRKQVSTNNYISGLKMYIKLNGRLGSNNENNVKYRNTPERIYPSHRNISLNDARFVDAYLYERKTDVQYL